METYMVLQNSAEIRKAIDYARELHKEQYRKGTKIPYFEHLIAVACMVKIQGGSNNQVIGGLLHDSLEDCPDKVNLDSLRRDFGPDVARIVEDCTEDKSIKDWRTRKEKHIEKVSQNIIQLSHLVIICDKLHNATSIIQDYLVIGPQIWDRFNASYTDLMWYYTGMVESLKVKSPVNFPPLDHLDRAVNVMRNIGE